MPSDLTEPAGLKSLKTSKTSYSVKCRAPEVLIIYRDVALENSPNKISDRSSPLSRENYKKYDLARKELVEKERHTWEPAIVRPGSALTDAEETFCAAANIVDSIREYERIHLFGSLSSDAVPLPGTLDMGGRFLINKNRIEAESQLYRIAQQVPKGAVLHLHFNTELHPAQLLEQARKMTNMYIRSIRPLETGEDLNKTEVVFSIMDENAVDNDVDIFSPTYIGNADNHKDPKEAPRIWMKWKVFQEKFKEESRFSTYKSTRKSSRSVVIDYRSQEPPIVLNIAEQWVEEKMVFSADEAYDPKQTLNGQVLGRESTGRMSS